MLQHYSTYKVAENFNLLSSLAPGRVDLGVGKAPGGLPLSTRALQGAYAPDRKPSFNEQLIELDKFLDQSPENTADRNGLAAYPVPPQNLNVSCWVRASKVLSLPHVSTGTSSMPVIFKVTRQP